MGGIRAELFCTLGKRFPIQKDSEERDTPSSRELCKGLGSCDVPHALSRSLSTEKMLPTPRSWLWFCISTALVLGHGGERECYQLHRLKVTLEGAESYCRNRNRGGHLPDDWNQNTPSFIQDSLEEGTKWWIGQKSVPLSEPQEKHSGKAPGLPVCEGNFLKFYYGRGAEKQA